MAEKKLKIGWHRFSCCEDNTIIFSEMLNDHFFKWKKIIDFKDCNLLKSKNDPTDIDVAFVEGAIASTHDLKRVTEIRKNSKYVVAIGSCACNGLPAGQRNRFPPEKVAQISPYLSQFQYLDKVKSLEEVIDVDDKVPGCPMSEDNFLKALDKYLKLFKII